MSRLALLFASILVILLFAVAPPASASSWKPLYQGAPLYDIGVFPDSQQTLSEAYDIASGDLNGDGLPDLVATNVESGLGAGTTITVLLHSKYPALGVLFEKKKLFTVPASPHHVELADMNQDGKLDIVVSAFSGPVSVLFGDGTGGFSAHVDYATPALSGGLGVADFNGDGWPDVAVGAGSNVAVLLGTGGGALGAPTMYPSGLVNVGELRAGDATGDGVADIAVVAGTSAPTIAVLIGNGAGAFASLAGPYTVGSTDATDLAIGDINLDGLPDLAVTLPTDMGIAILMGTGGSTFSAPAFHGTGNLHSPNYVAIGDVDGDNDPDILTTEDGFGAVFPELAIFRGKGDGDLFPPSFASMSPGAAKLILADFDQDGALDVAAAVRGNTYGHEVNVLLNGGTGQFPGAIVSPNNFGGRGVIADFNRDGKMDLAEAGSAIRIDFGTGTGSFTPGPSFSAGNPNFLSALDLNHDGIPDLVYYLVDTHSVYRTLGFGDGTFGAPVGIASSNGEARPLLVDMNRDSRPDLVLSNGNSFSIWVQNADGTFTSASTTGIPGIPTIRSFGAVDWDRDGKPDLAVAASNGLRIYHGNGDGTITGAVTLSSRDYRAVCAGDFNRDGKPDLAARDSGGALGVAHGIDLFLGSGGGVVPATVIPTLDPFGTQMFMWDADRDGYPDLITDNESFSTYLQGFELHAMSVVPGRGVDDITARRSDYVLGIASDIIPGDVNGDGTNDVVTFGQENIGPTADDTGLATFTLLAKPPTQGNGLLPKTDYSALTGTNRVILSDLNRDGILDLVTCTPSASPGVTVRFGDAMGGFGAPTTIASSREAVDIAVADLNQDGIPDIAGVAILGTKSTLWRMFGVGDGTFGARLDFPGIAQLPSAIRIADMNHDGINDIVEAASGSIATYQGNGAGTYGGLTPTVISGVTAFDLADINRDGNLDVVAANGSVNILFGTGTGTFGTPNVDPVGGTPTSVAIGDVDGDGAPDIIASVGGGSPFLAVLMNLEGAMPTQTNTPLPSVASDVRIGRAQGDGNLFAYLTYSGTNTLQLMQLAASGGATSVGTYATGSAPTRIAIDDIKRDALPDVAVANSSDGSVSVLLHGPNLVTGVSVTAVGTAPRARLEQNYPNPFNPSTTIRYSIASRSRVQLKVFDVTGRLVTTLVDATKEAGPHEVSWRGRNAEGQQVASGVYFYRFTTDHGFAESRTMVLLK